MNPVSILFIPLGIVFIIWPQLGDWNTLAYTLFKKALDKVHENPGEHPQKKEAPGIFLRIRLASIRFIVGPLLILLGYYGMWPPN